MTPNNSEPQLRKVIDPSDPDLAGFSITDADGRTMESLTLDRRDDPDEPIVAQVHDSQTGDIVEVVMPPKIKENDPAEFRFTKRHKKAMQVAGALTITAAIGGGLVAYMRKKHK